MAAPVRFRYTRANDLTPVLMPRLALMLTYETRNVEVMGLLDTGAVVNVLPYQLGLALGANWHEQPISVPLAGNLGQLEARGLVVTAFHPRLTLSGPIKLAFAWTLAENVPVIFGQTNFFLEFDVCFYRAQGAFEVHPHEGT